MCSPVWIATYPSHLLTFTNSAMFCSLLLYTWTYMHTYYLTYLCVYINRMAFHFTIPIPTSFYTSDFTFCRLVFSAPFSPWIAIVMFTCFRSITKNSHWTEPSFLFSDNDKKNKYSRRENQANPFDKRRALTYNVFFLFLTSTEHRTKVEV